MQSGNSLFREGLLRFMVPVFAKMPYRRQTTVPSHADVGAPLPQRILIAAVTVALVYPAAAGPATSSGDDLLAGCRAVATGTHPAPNDSTQAGICFGELEALNWLAPGQKSTLLRSCVPDDVTVQQMAKVVVAYIEQHRDRAREPFQGLALEALASTWPCQESRGWFERFFGK